MNILAIETATEACSVALLTDAGIVQRFELAPRRHAELVLPMADAVLAEAGLAKSQLDAIAFGRGPGAFTGVRLAVSVAQGLALALDRPVVPVSTLAALALDAAAAAAVATGVAPTGSPGASSMNVGATPVATPGYAKTAILAVIDARMGEVYAACFAVDDDLLVTPLTEESVGPAQHVILPAHPEWIVAGSGWAAYEAVLRERLAQAPIAEFPDLLPRAASIARLAARELRAGRGVDAALALPVYLRDKVALTIAERAEPHL